MKIKPIEAWAMVENNRIVKVFERFGDATLFRDIYKNAFESKKYKIIKVKITPIK